MNAQNQPFWEDAYKSKDTLNVFNGGKPSDNVVRIAGSLSPAPLFSIWAPARDRMRCMWHSKALRRWL